MDNKEKIPQSKILSANNDLLENMKQSFEFWHKIYDDSFINYPLVWKKALESNSEIMKRIEEGWQNNMKQNSEIQIQQFLELWSNAIRKSNFEITKKSMQDWHDFWMNTTQEQLKIYSEILEMLTNYWKSIQNKNIE